jgi:hypothetical protein
VPVLCISVCMSVSVCVYVYVCMYVCTYVRTRAVLKVRELAAVRRCYAEEGGECYAKLEWWG